MRRIAMVAMCAIALVAGLLGSTSPAAAEVAGPDSGIWVRGSGGAIGSAYVPPASITGVSLNDQRLWVTWSSGGRSESLTLGAPPGGTLSSDGRLVLGDDVAVAWVADQYCGRGAYRVLENDTDPTTGEVRFAAVFSLRCDTGVRSGAVYINSALTPAEPTFLEVVAPPTGPPLADVAVSGTLTSWSGAPQAGRDVSMLDPVTGATRASVTTDASGAFTTVENVDELLNIVVASFPGGAGASPALALDLVIVAPRTSTLTAVQPEPSFVDDGPVTIHGVLVDTAGPVAGATVYWGNFPPVVSTTTAADGSFSLSLPETFGLLAGSWNVPLAFDGTTFSGEAAATVVVERKLHPSAMLLTAPARSERAQPYSVEGLLTQGGLPRAGAVVTLTRKDLVGTTTTQATTGDDGRFLVEDVPAAGGSVTWTASWAGSSVAPPASASAVVYVPRLVTDLTIATDQTVYAWGTTAKIRAHLGTTFSGRTIRIYAQRADQSYPRVIASGTVDSQGYLRATYTMVMNTTFSAGFGGDAQYAPATAKASRLARAKVTVGIRDPISRSGAFYTVRAGKKAFGYIQVRPGRSKALGCITGKVQRLVDGVWRTTQSSPCVGRFSDSTTDVWWNFAIGMAGTGRLRLVLGSPADATNAASNSGWVYLKFV